MTSHSFFVYKEAVELRHEVALRIGVSTEEYRRATELCEFWYNRWRDEEGFAIPHKMTRHDISTKLSGMFYEMKRTKGENPYPRKEAKINGSNN